MNLHVFFSAIARSPYGRAGCATPRSPRSADACHVSCNTPRCIVVGGGPAGVMLGLLLARAGVPVTVLEKHGDFLRDFRGDTVHPSTLAILDEIGLRERFDKLPQRRVDHLAGIVGGREQQIVDLRGLKPYDYLALVPQWDFLDMLADAGRKLPTFDLRMRHAATGL